MYVLYVMRLNAGDLWRRGCKVNELEDRVYMYKLKGTYKALK